MRLICFSPNLTVTEIQAISVQHWSGNMGYGYAIQAEFNCVSNRRVYYIFLSADNQEGYEIFKTAEEANKLLEKVLISSTDGIIDLRKFDNLICLESEYKPSVCITNVCDDFEEYPLMVSLMQ